MGQWPQPPIDLPDRFDEVDDPDFDRTRLAAWIDRATIALMTIAVLGIAAQFLRAWIGGML